MDQTIGIDRTKPLATQIMEVLDKRYYIEGDEDAKHLMDGMLGGRFQHHKKVAMAIVSLASDYYHKHPEETREYDPLA